MADNINKVVYGDETLIDLTADTVTAETLAEGETAHDKSGRIITGTMSSKGGSIPIMEADYKKLTAEERKGKSYYILDDSQEGGASETLIDNITIVKDENGKFSVPIDNKTIYIKNGKLTAKGGGAVYKLEPPTNIVATKGDEEVTISWTDPNDLEVQGNVVAIWQKTVIVRKTGGAPTSETDGTVVCTETTRNQYSVNGFVDKNLENDITYYYGIFPCSTDEEYTTIANVSATPEAIYPSAVTDITITTSSDEQGGIITLEYEKPNDAVQTSVYLSKSSDVSNTNYEKSNKIITQRFPTVIFDGLELDTTYYFVVYSQNQKNRKTKGEVKNATISASGFSKWVKTRESTKNVAQFSDLTEAQMRELMTVHASVDNLVEWLTNKPSDFEQFATSRIAMKWIGLRDYCCDKLMAIDSIKTAMLESEYWEYILKDKVPVMTDYTAPYGEVVFVGTEYSTSYARNVFDRTSNVYFTQTSLPINVGYKFVNPIKVNRFSITSKHDRQSPKGLVLEGLSNDGLNWREIGSYVDSTPRTGAEITTSFEVNNDNYYMGYRVRVTSCQGTSYVGTEIVELQFYGRSLNESVPTMTSNTEPMGEVKSVPYMNDFYPWKAFDKDESTFSLSANGTLFGDYYVEYDFVKEVAIQNYYLSVNGNKPIYPAYYKIQAYVDNAWTDITDELSIGNSSAEKHTASGRVTKTVAKKFRIQFTKSNYQYASSTYAIMVQELNFYGVSYSEEEFGNDGIETLYDNGIKFGDYQIRRADTTNTPYSTLTENEDDVLYESTQTTSAWTQGTYWLFDKKLDLSLYKNVVVERKVLKSEEEYTTACVLTRRNNFTNYESQYVSNLIGSSFIRDISYPIFSIESINEDGYLAFTNIYTSVKAKISINKIYLVKN